MRNLSLRNIRWRYFEERRKSKPQHYFRVPFAFAKLNTFL